MPAKLLKAARQCVAGGAERQWRQRRLVRRVGGISGQPRDPHHPIVFREERLERLVVDWPIVRHAVISSHPEVAGSETREVGGPENRAAADRVEHHRRDRRFSLVDGVVRGQTPDVWVGGELPLTPRLPIQPVRREIRLLHPGPLLQAEDAHAGIGNA